jgi:hypothetical protein
LDLSSWRRSRGSTSFLSKVGIAPQGELNLDSYVARWIVPFPFQLERWAAIAGDGAVNCRLYDEDCPALLMRLLETVHPPAVAALLDEPAINEPRLVNRSPTASELLLLRRLNEEPDAASLCTRLTEGVMNAPPTVPEPLVVSEAAFAAFEANNASRVKALNERWLQPAGRMPLCLTSGRIRIGPPQSMQVEEALVSCFIGTVRRMEQEMHALRTEAKRFENKLSKS